MQTLDTPPAEPDIANFKFDDAMKAVRDRNHEQFENLHREFFDLVMGTAYKVLNDRHDAEEVAQEVFATLWKKAGLYDSRRGKLSVWLATMARNRAIDRLRSKVRRSQLHDDLESEAEPQKANRYVDDVVATVGRSEESEIVRGAVTQLNPEQRKAIELTYFKGMSQSEAAAALKTPLGTIKARVRRALIRLRSLVPELAFQ